MTLTTENPQIGDKVLLLFLDNGSIECGGDFIYGTFEDVDAPNEGLPSYKISGEWHDAASEAHSTLLFKIEP